MSNSWEPLSRILVGRWMFLSEVLDSVSKLAKMKIEKTLEAKRWLKGLVVHVWSCIGLRACSEHCWVWP